MFVSFARAGNALLPRLFERLEAQAIRVWNYDRPEQAIQLTEQLSPAIEQQLASATHFVAFVSDAALDNPHVVAEVTRALQLHALGQIQIAVLVDARAKVALQNWPKPFAPLAAFRYATLDLEDRESIASVVQELCAAFGVEYAPELVEAGRVRLIGRLYDELRTATARSSNRERDTFVRIVRILEKAHLALEAFDEEKATKLMALAISFIEQEYPTLSLYYPKVLHAVQLARTGQLTAALAELRALVDTPVRDACVFSALAYVQYQLCDFAAALTAYERASTLPHADAADALGALLCRLRLKRKGHLERELAAIERLPHFAGDEPMLELTKGIAYRLDGRPKIAAGILEPLLPRAPLPLVAEVAEELTYALLKIGGCEAEAHRALLFAREKCPHEPRILRSLSLVYRTLDPARRLKICRVLAHDHARDLPSAYEALCGLWQCGSIDEAQALARDFLQHHAFPHTPFEAYICGAAHWILADPLKANIEYERSGMSLPYSEYLAHL